MKPQAMMMLVPLGLILTGCKESVSEVPETPETPPVVDESSWIPLQGQWSGVMGGAVDETDDALRLGWGEALTAARWGGEVPEVPFEVEAQARRIDGTDFFFSLTFPGATEGEAATWLVGGWGGGVVGISSVDGEDAEDNETTRIMPFETKRWYDLRLSVERERIQAWIDEERVIDLDLVGKALSLRPGPVEACLPFGVATWQTTGEIREMRWRSLAEAP